MELMIDPTYLPFPPEDLQKHFTADAERRIDYFMRSAARYREFRATYPDRKGISLSVARTPCQIEKDETFWTATALKHLIEAPDVAAALAALLQQTFGDTPPLDDLGSWSTCVDGDLHLFLEAPLRSSRSYLEWLRHHRESRHLIPYVLHAGARETAHVLEGKASVDAIILNASNGFALAIEAKVLSDVSHSISFDSFHNQIARNLDVLLEDFDRDPGLLAKRNPDRTLFALLTPEVFREKPHARLYGRLIREYQNDPGALRRDLEHRTPDELSTLPQRIGWITFEDICAVVPGACPWLGT